MTFFANSGPAHPDKFITVSEAASEHAATLAYPPQTSDRMTG
jgi:hypothetical protein